MKERMKEAGSEVTVQWKEGRGGENLVDLANDKKRKRKKVKKKKKKKKAIEGYSQNSVGSETGNWRGRGT